jgi:hypothetical protein
MLGTEVDKLPGYDPAGVYQVGHMGHLHTDRPDLRGPEWRRFEEGHFLHRESTPDGVAGGPGQYP